MIGATAVGAISRRYFLEKTVELGSDETNPILHLFNYDKSSEYYSAEAYERLIESCVPVIYQLIAESELQKAGHDCPVVLSVPGSLDGRQRMALKHAAQKAGCNVLRVIDDETAREMLEQRINKSMLNSLTPAALTAVGAALKAVELSYVRRGVYMRKETPPS